MRMGAGLVGLAMALGGCMPMEPVEEQIPTREDPNYTCNAARLQGMIGATATRELAADAVRTAGARSMRWISPDGAYTMDYRPDRLNIHVDRQNRITKIICG